MSLDGEAEVEDKELKYVLLQARYTYNVPSTSFQWSMQVKDPAGIQRIKKQILPLELQSHITKNLVLEGVDN